MDPVYMTKMSSAFIEELTELRKLAYETAPRLPGVPPPIPADAVAKAPGMFTRGRQAMGEGFQTMGNVVGGSGPMAQRMGAPAGQTLGQHLRGAWEGGKIPTIENVAGKAGQAAKTVTRGGGMLGGLKAVAGTRFGKMLGAVGAVGTAGALAHKVLSRPKQPAYPQGY